MRRPGRQVQGPVAALAGPCAVTRHVGVVVGAVREVRGGRA